MPIPDNEPVLSVNYHCNVCGGEAYWDITTVLALMPGWRHVSEADAIFCAILDAATQISQL